MLPASPGETKLAGWPQRNHRPLCRRYSSSSRLYERTATQLGMTPEKYPPRRRGRHRPLYHRQIGQSDACSSLPPDKGICAIQFANSEQELLQGLMREFPFADPPSRRPSLGAMASEPGAVCCRAQPQSLSSHRHPSTAFQRRVWEALQEIPRGETRS